MTRVFSTMQKEMGAGRVYSTQHAASVTPQAPRRAMPAAPPQAPVRTPLLGQAFAIPLRPAGSGLGYGGQAASGRVVLTEAEPGRWHLAAEATGLPVLADPAVRATLWLIQDLRVPHDLAPADAARLPRGAQGTGNQPGEPYTLDGNPPTYGLNGNTLAIAIAPGALVPEGGERHALEAAIDASTNCGFHPLYLAGPEALANANEAVPSGTLAALLTDLCLRPATVYPDLPVTTQFLPRLRAVASRHLGAQAPTYLDPAQFSRAAVTLEGPVRHTPWLLPTRETCLLMGTRSDP